MITINATEARALHANLTAIIRSLPKAKGNGAPANGHAPAGGPPRPSPKWSARDLATLDAEYGKTPTQALALKLGKTPTQLHPKAKERGLTTNREPAANGATP